ALRPAAAQRRSGFTRLRRGRKPPLDVGWIDTHAFHRSVLYKPNLESSSDQDGRSDQVALTSESQLRHRSVAAHELEADGVAQQVLGRPPRRFAGRIRGIRPGQDG